MTFQPPPPRSPSPPAISAKARALLICAVWGILLLQAVTSDEPLTRNPAMFGFFGAVGGMIAVQVQILVVLLLGRLGGQAPTLLMVGTGPLLRVLRLGPLSVAVRPIPLLPLQTCTTLVAGPAVRARLLLGGLARVAVPAAIGIALLLLAPSPLLSLGFGFVFIALISLIAGTKQAGSTAWLIFRAPFLDERLLSRLTAGPEELAAQRALMGARIDEARATVAQVSPETLMGTRLHVAVAIADGRYREALATLFASPAEHERLPETPGGELLAARAALFGMESGELPRDEAQATVANALASATARIPRLIAASEIPATQALLEGRAPEALALAKASLRRPTDLQTRAYALCTLAAAQAVTGDSPAARATLAQARTLTPDLARIATVERLVAELPLMRDHV